MKYQLVKPQKEIEKQMQTIYQFVLENGDFTSVAEPKTLVDGWHNGQIRIFTASQEETIKAINITLVIKDPIAHMKHHLITAFEYGVDEGFSAFIDNALLVFK